MDSIKTGKFIQELRKAKKLTQNDLADLLQVTNKAISRWETGEGFPDVVLLPRLSEVLSVTIDDILNGERKTNIISHNTKDKQKLLNVYKICLTIISLSFVLFIGLTYTTFKVWIGFMAHVIPSTLALVWVLIARSNYMDTCEYNDEDKKILFDTLKISVTLYSVLFALMFVQFLALVSQYAFNFIRFQDFILVSFITGGLVFFGTSWYFNSIDINQNKNKTTIHKKFTVYFAILIIICIGVFFLSPLNNLIPFEGIPIISIISVSCLVYISFGIYYLIKKTDSVMLFFLRVITTIAVIFINSPLSFMDGDSSFLETLPIIIYFGVLLISIVGFTLKFIKNTKDSLLRFYFQNIFLFVYFFFYIFGLIMLIAIVIIFGILDIFIDKKIDSRTSISLNKNPI